MTLKPPDARARARKILLASMQERRIGGHLLMSLVNEDRCFDLVAQAITDAVANERKAIEARELASAERGRQEALWSAGVPAKVAKPLTADQIKYWARSEVIKVQHQSDWHKRIAVLEEQVQEARNIVGDLDLKAIELRHKLKVAVEAFSEVLAEVGSSTLTNKIVTQALRSLAEGSEESKKVQAP